MATFLEIALWNAAAAAVLALAAAAASRLFRRPALTHTLWVLVLLKLVTPPLVPFTLTLPAAEDRPAPPAEGPAVLAPDDADAPAADVAWEKEEEAPPAALPEPDPVPSVAPAVDWGRWAGLAWLVGSALWAAWVAWHVVRFRRVLRLARLAPGHLRGEAEALARRLGLRKCPEVWLVPGAVSPMVWGLGGRPCLLFPTGLLDRLDAGGRAALLAHELAHVRRRDHWVRLLELAATGLYWWHPALWWARRELHEAEEQCCDAWAVWALGGDARPYALALLQAVAFVSQARLPLPLGASGVGQVSHLKRRLTMVMQGKTSRSLSWAGLGAVLGLGLLLLPLFPALGQQPPRRAPAVEGDPAAPAADRNQQIDQLKRALAALEAQKAQEAAGQDTKDATAQVLQAQLRELDRAMAANKKQLAELMTQAERVRTQLKELEGRPDPRPRNRSPGAVVPPRTSDGRVEDLEKKLDRIQKELEELRRELKPGRTPRSGTGFPGGPAAPELPPAVRRPDDGTSAAPGTPLPSRNGPPPATGDAPPVPAPPAPPALAPRGAAPPAPPTTPLPPADVAPPGAAPPPPLPTPRTIPPAADTAPPPATTPRS